MHAAVVSTFSSAPRFAEFPVPVPQNEDEVLIDVVAAALHPRVRSQADGSHYTSTDELPLVPGIDGVGRMADGTLRYFLLPDTAMGAMAEQTVIDVRRSVTLPSGADPVLVAAAMNPAMSSWVALRRRIEFTAGQRVLVMGATGSAGGMAVQIAKLFGASHVVAAGRDAMKLDALLATGADATVSLTGDPDDVARQLAEAAGDVDVVIDYLWGQPTADALRAIVPNRTDEAQPFTWIQIGSMAGLESPIPSAALRAARLQIVGSGQGSASPPDIIAELPELATAISSDTFAIDARTMPLSEVEAAWALAPTTTDRVVLVP